MKKILFTLLASVATAQAGDDLLELEAAAKAKISATKAVEIAEADAKGTANKLDTELHKDGKLVYEVEVRPEGKEIDLTIDADSGEVLLRKEEQNNSPTPAVKLSLKEAIAKAETDGQKVLEIDLDHHNGQLVYEAKTFKDKTVREIHLDSNSGALIDGAAPAASPAATGEATPTASPAQ